MGRRIRVAHVIQTLAMGGLEQLVMRLCAAGSAFDVEPVVITFLGGGALEAPLRKMGVDVIALDEARGLSPRLLRRLGRAIAAVRPDVLHAHDLAAWVNATVARGVPLPGRPAPRVVVTLHETRVPERALRYAAMACAEGTGAVVACGEAVRSVTASWLPRGVPLRVIGNGVPLPLLEGSEGDRARSAARERLARALEVRGPLPMGIWIGYLGRLEEEKGTDVLVEAFLQAFRTPLGKRLVGDDGLGPNLVLIGEGGLAGHLQRRAGAWLGRRIHFTGEVPDGAGLLPALDLYAQPSRREGRSLAMLEAMAAGLPSVAPKLEAVAEIHRDGETALLVPPGDAKPVAEALRVLASSAPLRHRMGEAARRHVRAHSVEGMAAEYAALYREGLEAASAAE